MTALTSAERKLQSTLVAFSLIYIAAGASFMLAPHWVVTVLNSISTTLDPRAHLLPLPSERFWLALVGSLMLTLIFLSLTAARDVRKNKVCVQAILISKFCSTLFFIIFYKMSGGISVYLLAALTDGIIFFIHFILYRRAVRSATHAFPLL